MKFTVRIFLLLAVAAVSTFAQVTSRVAGQIEDTSGSVVPQATVTLTNEATAVSVSTTSTSAGTYVFDGIQPGTYSLAVQAVGFSKFV